MCLWDHLDYHLSTFVSMIDLMKDDDALLEIDITNLIVLDLLERVLLHSIQDAGLYSNDMICNQWQEDKLVMGFSSPI